MPECYTAGRIEERTGIVDRHAEPGTDGGIPSLAQAARECLRRGTAWCGMRVGLDAGGAPVLGGDICFNADDGETPRYAVAGKNTAGGASRAACAERERYFRARGGKAKSAEMRSRF